MFLVDWPWEAGDRETSRGDATGRYVTNEEDRTDECACVVVGCGPGAVGNTKGLGRPPTAPLHWQGSFLSATRQANLVPTTKDSTSNLANKREDSMDYIIFKTSPHNACNFLF